MNFISFATSLFPYLSLSLTLSLSQKEAKCVSTHLFPHIRNFNVHHSDGQAWKRWSSNIWALNRNSIPSFGLVTAGLNGHIPLISQAWFMRRHSNNINSKLLQFAIIFFSFLLLQIIFLHAFDFEPECKNIK